LKKTILKTITTLGVLGAVSLSASSFTYNTRSLVGIEGSYNTFDVEHTTPTTRETKKYAGVGLKIGAQTDNYRLFLSARDNFISGYNYAYTYGVEAQYLMNFSSFMNMYVGGAGGYANMRFVDFKDVSREVATPYYGGDVGFNIHMGDSLDLELGGRIVKLSNGSHTQNSITYKFDNIVSGYMSLIFKYSMDEH